MVQTCKCRRQSGCVDSEEGKDADSCDSEKRCLQIEDLFQPDLFKALGDRNRLSILAWLARAGQPCSVSEVASCCPIDLSVVSRHLNVLKQVGVLEASKSGRQVRYCVNFSELADALRRMADAIDACCPPKKDQESKHTEEDTSGNSGESASARNGETTSEKGGKVSTESME